MRIMLTWLILLICTITQAMEHTSLDCKDKDEIKRAKAAKKEAWLKNVQEIVKSDHNNPIQLIMGLRCLYLQIIRNARIENGEFVNSINHLSIVSEEFAKKSFCSHPGCKAFREIYKFDKWSDSVTKIISNKKADLLQLNGCTSEQFEQLSKSEQETIFRDAIIAAKPDLIKKIKKMQSRTDRVFNALWIASPMKTTEPLLQILDHTMNDYYMKSSTLSLRLISLLKKNEYWQNQHSNITVHVITGDERNCSIQ